MGFVIGIHRELSMIGKPATQEKQVEGFHRHFAVKTHMKSQSHWIFGNANQNRRHHFTPAEMAVIRQTITSADRTWRNWNPHGSLVEM